MLENKLEAFESRHKINTYEDVRYLETVEVTGTVETIKSNVLINIDLLTLIKEHLVLF